MTAARKPVWTATVLTLLPEMFPGPLTHSLAGKALEEGIWALETVDIRAFARDKHCTVDDAPFGGGPGMVISTLPAFSTHQPGAVPALLGTPVAEGMMVV